MSNLTFKPKNITKKLLGVLPTRARDILTKRYGLGASAELQTLESIGQVYGITRERVRQIENHAITLIQKSDAYKESQDVFDEFKSIINDLGGIVAETELLDLLAKDEATKNNLHFLLVLGAPFNRSKENNTFQNRWYVETENAKAVEKALEQLHGEFADENLVSESEIINSFVQKLAALGRQEAEEERLKRWLMLSKVLGRNPLGEWGLATSPNVRAKGIRDFAYLAVKRHGSPMHFREVAEAIEELFARKAHVATCHNELIKDERFVLVGRGLYALTEWGYSSGVVKEVLQDIFRKEGPLTREEIIDKVRKERYVKDNTIIVNLQDTTLFKRLSDGSYTLAE